MEPAGGPDDRVGSPRTPPHRLLTLRDRPGRFLPCVSRFSVKFPASKPSRPGPVFARSPDCDESMDEAAGASAKALPGSTHVAELHRYEATGIGRKEFKIEHLL